VQVDRLLMTSFTSLTTLKDHPALAKTPSQIPGKTSVNGLPQPASSPRRHQLWTPLLTARCETFSSSGLKLRGARKWGPAGLRRDVKVSTARGCPARTTFAQTVVATARRRART
jgi:hypothetical protein